MHSRECRCVHGKSNRDVTRTQLVRSDANNGRLNYCNCAGYCRHRCCWLGVPSTTFYRWYDRFQTGGPEGLEDRSPNPGRVWNRIPDDVRDRIIKLALDEPELSPRELAVSFTDMESYFVSEVSVYRLLKSHDLITSPAFIVIKAADEFKDKTTAPNQMWQTDFTYLKVIG